MINNITVTNHLEESITMELRFPEKSGFLIRSIDGVGPSKATIEMIEMSLMDGAIYNSARVGSRNIVFSLGFYGSEIEDVRQMSYKYFPLKKRIKMVFETDNRTCEVYGYVESNVPNIFSKEEGAIISVLCPDAYLFSTEGQITTFASITPVFEFPFGNESLTEKLLELSTISGYETQTIYYPGDAEVGMVMYIHAVGDVTMIEIFNLDTNESMKIDTDKIVQITGQGIHVGDDIVISTVMGNKYAYLERDGVRTNILNCIDKYPTWFRLVRGDNIFTYTAETGQLNLQFRIENQIAYEGI